ncbi:MAG: tetratricopeptide repeat protein [Gemmatimonadales bacterium]|nr:tetratricopeptide repeat protein [Gemmatimonadales bacterium]
MTPRRGLTLVIFLVAAVYWGLLLFQAEDSVFSRAPLLDELYYLDRAAEISTVGVAGSGPLFMSPLYPVLVAASGSGTGLSENGILPRGNLIGIRLIQVFCWFGVVILLRRMAGRTFAMILPPGRVRELVAWFPAVLFALYRPAAIFSLSVLVELPLLLLLTLALDLITPDLRIPNRPRRWRSPILGAVIGFAVLLRGTAILLLPVVAWVLWTETRGSRGRIRCLIGLALPLLILLAPAVIHNSLQAGRLTGPTLNAGLNLFIGNGDHANGFYVNLLPGDWREDPAGTSYLAEKSARSTVSVPEADALWFQATIEAVRRDPARTLSLFAKKIWLHFQGWEIYQLVSLAGWTEEVPLLRALVIPWRWMVVLGLAGLGFLAGRVGQRNQDLLVAARIWAVVLLVLVLGQSFFFVVSRYRLVMVPTLCLLSGLAVATWLGSGVRQDGAGRLRVWMVLAGLLGLILSHPWGLSPVKEYWSGQALANHAHRWALVAGEDTVGFSTEPFERAEELYREALAGPSSDREWWLALALVQLSRGREAEAESTLTEGDKAFPGDLRIQRTWLGLLLDQDRGEEALFRAEKILRNHSRDADTLHNYAILLARQGRLEEAAEAAGKLISVHPQDPRGYVDLGILLARSGNIIEARRVFEQGLVAVPGHPDLTRNLALLIINPD